MKELLSFVIRKFEVLKRRLRYQNEDLPYYITLVIAIIFFILAMRIFIELADELAEDELENFDNIITKWVLSFRSESLTPFFQFVTELGDLYAYITIIIGLASYLWLRFRNWKFSAQMITVLLLATFSNIAIKHIVNRARPSIDHLVTVNTLSFPSGHSMSSMAFYGFLVYLTLRSRLAGLAKALLSSFLILLIFSVGISRIYLGVHFPSDVAAGFMGGLLWVALCAIVLNIIELWRRKRGNALIQDHKTRDLT